MCFRRILCVSIRMPACFGSVLFSLQQNSVCCVVLVWLAYLSDCLFMRSIPIWWMAFRTTETKFRDLFWFGEQKRTYLFPFLKFFLLYTYTSFLGCKSIFLNHLKLLLDPVLFPLTINSAPRVKQNIRC